MKSEIATAGRNKSIPDLGQLIVTLGDVNWTLFRQGKESSRFPNPVLALQSTGKTSSTGQVQILGSRKGEGGIFATFPTDPICAVWHAYTTLPLGSWLLSLFSEIKRHDLLLHFWMSYLRAWFLVQSLARRVFPLTTA